MVYVHRCELECRCSHVAPAASLHWPAPNEIMISGMALKSPFSAPLALRVLSPKGMGKYTIFHLHVHLASAHARACSKHVD